MRLERILLTTAAVLICTPVGANIPTGGNVSTGSNISTGTCVHDEHNFRCVEFFRNYDGDTITVNIPDVHQLIGQKANVRIKGIDTPELRTKDDCEKKIARDAKLLVYKKLRNAKRIDLLNVSRDKYFRILADVIVDGESLSSLLKKKGYAYEYDGGTKTKMDWCQHINQHIKEEEA